MSSRITIIGIAVALVFAALIWMPDAAADKFLEFIKWAMSAGVAGYTLRPTSGRIGGAGL